MLLWEKLSARAERARAGPAGVSPAVQASRLPYETRCAAVTKSGRRCRGKIHGDSDYCPFHDPAVAERRKARKPTSAERARRRLTHLPDGYLRKLNSRRAVGHAMDRLYREITLGIITVEMGSVLFAILTRLLDSGLCDAGLVSPHGLARTKAHRMRPRLAELLTRAEKKAWKKAVANAPERMLRPTAAPAAASRPAVSASNPAVPTGPNDSSHPWSAAELVVTPT